MPRETVATITADRLVVVDHSGELVMTDVSRQVFHEGLKSWCE